MAGTSAFTVPKGVGAFEDIGGKAAELEDLSYADDSFVVPPKGIGAVVDIGG